MILFALSLVCGSALGVGLAITIERFFWEV